MSVNGNSRAQAKTSTKDKYANSVEFKKSPVRARENSNTRSLVDSIASEAANYREERMKQLVLRWGEMLDEQEQLKRNLKEIRQLSKAERTKKSADEVALKDELLAVIYDRENYKAYLEKIGILQVVLQRYEEKLEIEYSNSENGYDSDSSDSEINQNYYNYRFEPADIIFGCGEGKVFTVDKARSLHEKKSKLAIPCKLSRVYLNP